jgi:hypothetical protein
MRSRISLLVAFVLLSLACGPLAQSLPHTPTASPALAAPTTVPPILLDTPTVEPTPTQTQTLAPTDTILPTATTDPQSVTLQAQVGSMGFLMNISQYFHPVGTPLQSWHDVPVMPQATAGQEFSVQVYSYVAAATLAEAQQYYAAKAAALGLTNPVHSGSTGVGGQGVNSFTYFSSELAIELLSYDNDTGHVNVVISRAQ